MTFDLITSIDRGKIWQGIFSTLYREVMGE